MAPSGAVTSDDKQTSGLFLPDQPKLIVPEKKFTYFKTPREPRVTVRGDTYEFEYEKDENGNHKLDAKGRRIFKRDAHGKKIHVLDEDGNKKVKRKRAGYVQANNLEIKRCVRAVETREKAIALAEKKLSEAKTPLAIEKAKERLEVATMRRDYTLKRLDLLLNHANEHNVVTLAKRSDTVYTDAAKNIKHLIDVREDIVLTAAIKAGGSASHTAFDKLRNEYKWLVNKFARPGKTPLEPEDAFSGGVRGLWDAAMRYDATRSSATYSTVAYNWVRRNTRARTRADAKPGQIMIDGKLKHSISIDAQRSDNDEEPSEFSLVSSESSTLTDSMKLDVAEALASLDGMHQEILKMRHFSNLSYDEIARTVSMPVNLVKQLTTEAHRKLQEKLKAYGA